MSPIYKTGGGAAASNSVAATKEETPTGTKIMRGGFNNDKGADDKRLSVSTTPRTDLSALSPISRYYCRRNWYIDINGYHQFQTSYDKIVINNKDNNNSNYVTAPKERVPDNTNEEQEDSELNNQDVNNDYEVIITPETTPHTEGVLKVRDSSKSNTTSVATKKNTPTGQRETGGGVKNDTSNRKSTASIMTKSNLYALRNNDTAPRKEGVSPTGQREIGKRFNNDASMGNGNSLSVTAPRANLSSYIESNKCYCTSYDKLDINNKNNNNNNKDANNCVITSGTTPRKEGVSNKEQGCSESKNSVPTKRTTPTGEKRTEGFKNDAGNKKNTTAIITKSNRSSPPIHRNKYGPRKKGVPKEHDSSEPYKDSNTPPPRKEGVWATKRNNNNKEFNNIPINNKTHRKEGVGFIWYEQVPRLDTNPWIPVTAGLDSVNNRKIVMPSPGFITPTNNAYAALSEEDDGSGIDNNNKGRTDVIKIRTDDNSFDKFKNNTVVPSKEREAPNTNTTTTNNKNTIVYSREGVLPNNNNTNTNNAVRSINTIGPSEEGADKNNTDNNTNSVRSNSTNTDAVQYNSNDNKRNKSDDVDDTVFHPPDRNNNIDPSNKGVGISKINKERLEEIKIRTDDKRDGDPTKEGVEGKSVRSEELAFDNNDNTNGNNNNPSKDGVRVVDNNHDNNNGNTSKEGVRAINTNHLKEGVGKTAVRSNDTNNKVNKGVGDDPPKEGVPVVDDCHDNTSECTPVPGLQGLSGDEWSDSDSCDNCYDDGEIGICTNAMNNNNNVVQPVDNDHSKIGVSGKEQTNTNHVIGIVIHEYNHNDHFIGNIIHECSHSNEKEYESSDKDSDDDSEYESSDDGSDDDSECGSSVEDSSDDDDDFYIRTQCDWCYTNRCECNYQSDNGESESSDNSDSDDDTEYGDKDDDEYSNTDSDYESSESSQEDEDELSNASIESPKNSAVVAVTMYHENKAVYVSSDEEEEETDDEDSGVSYLSRGSTFYTYYGGEYFYDKNGDLHYCGQYDSNASDPGDNGIPDVISCSSNDDSSDDEDDDSSYYESCDCEDPKCDCDAEMRYNQYKRKHQLENPELYELKFKLDNPTLFPRLHGYLQKVPKLRNYLLPNLNNDKYKQQMEELSEADDESDDGDNIINDGCNGYNNRRNYYNINNRYTLNNNNNVNHNDEAYVHNNNDYENHNDEEASIDSNSEDEESEDELEDESEGENGDISDVENDDASVNNFNNDNNDDRNNNVDDQDININQNDNNSVAGSDGGIDNNDDISVDDDTVNTTNNEDDSSVDTDNDNDDTYDDINDSSGDDDEASIPKELQNYNAEGSYWSTNDRPSYATVAARSSDDNNESTDVTIGAIILPRTAKNLTLGLVSGTET